MIFWEGGEDVDCWRVERVVECFLGEKVCCGMGEVLVFGGGGLKLGIVMWDRCWRMGLGCGIELVEVVVVWKYLWNLFRVLWWDGWWR